MQSGGLPLKGVIFKDYKEVDEDIAASLPKSWFAAAN